MNLLLPPIHRYYGVFATHFFEARPGPVSEASKVPASRAIQEGCGLADRAGITPVKAG